MRSTLQTRGAALRSKGTVDSLMDPLGRSVELLIHGGFIPSEEEMGFLRDVLLPDEHAVIELERTLVALKRRVPETIASFHDPRG